MIVESYVGHLCVVAEGEGRPTDPRTAVTLADGTSAEVLCLASTGPLPQERWQTVDLLTPFTPYLVVHNRGAGSILELGAVASCLPCACAGEHRRAELLAPWPTAAGRRVQTWVGPRLLGSAVYPQCGAHASRSSSRNRRARFAVEDIAFGRARVSWLSEPEVDARVQHWIRRWRRELRDRPVESTPLLPGRVRDLAPGDLGHVHADAIGEDELGRWIDPDAPLVPEDLSTPTVKRAPWLLDLAFACWGDGPIGSYNARDPHRHTVRVEDL